MKVRAKRTTYTAGKLRKAGDTFEVSQAKADELIKKGIAEKASGNEPAKKKENKPEKKTKEEKSGYSTKQEAAKKPKGDEDHGKTKG